MKSEINFSYLQGKSLSGGGLNTFACAFSLLLILSQAGISQPIARADESFLSQVKQKAEKSDKEQDKAADKKDAVKSPEPVIENVIAVQAQDLIDKPHEFLGKNVRFTAPFFAFSNLALDYKPAYRSSKTHIAFLVSGGKKRIPLSELKIAMMTPKEKDPETQLLATLKEGDTLEITARVFSTALDDPWVEVLKVKKQGASGDDKKADASVKAKSLDNKAADAKAEKTDASHDAAHSESTKKAPVKN